MVFFKTEDRYENRYIHNEASIGFHYRRSRFHDNACRRHTAGHDSTERFCRKSGNKEQQEKKISSAKDKISELEQKQADLDKQINSTKDDISRRKKIRKAIQEQIETVQETILTLEDSITDLETEIADL